MRRILLVLSVAALMAAMLVATAMPAFADKGGGKEHNWGTHGEYDRGVGNDVCDHPKIGCD